jgi:hypothetical protein
MRSDPEEMKPDMTDQKRICFYFALTLAYYPNIVRHTPQQPHKIISSARCSRGIVAKGMLGSGLEDAAISIGTGNR